MEIFISYSHDNNEHKQWVKRLAEKLLKLGVEVISDIWDVTPGCSLTTFMSNGLRDSSRVICICSELYVEKAEKNVPGGVNFEINIIADEFYSKGNQHKVIPIIKNNSRDKKVPTFFGKAFYIDFSQEEDAAQKFVELYKEIYQLNAKLKPSSDIYHNRKIEEVKELLQIVSDFWIADSDSEDEEKLIVKIANTKCKVDLPVTRPIIPPHNYDNKKEILSFATENVLNLIGGLNPNFVGDKEIIRSLIERN